MPATVGSPPSRPRRTSSSASIAIRALTAAAAAAAARSLGSQALGWLASPSSSLGASAAAGLRGRVGRPAATAAAAAENDVLTQQVLKRVPLEFQSRTPLPPSLMKLGASAWKFKGSRKDVKLAKGIQEAKTAEDVIALLEPQMDGFLLNRHHVTYALQSLARAKNTITDDVRDSQVIADLIEEVVDMVATDNIVPDQVAKIFFACVTLEQFIPEIKELLPVLQEAIQEHLPQMTSQHKQMLLKACAMSKLKRNDLDKFLPEVASSLVERAEDFTEENVPNILWCAAKLQGRLAPASAAALRDLAEVFASIVEVWLDRIPSNRLASIVWSLGKAQVDLEVAKPVLNKVAAKLEKGLETLPAQNLGMLCTGVAALGWAPEGFMARMADAIIQAAPGWSSEVLEYQLPLFAWSFAKVGVQNKALMQLVVDKSAQLVPQLVDWRLCSLAWVYTEIFVDPDFGQFSESLKAELARREIPEERMRQSELGFEAWLRNNDKREAKPNAE